MVELYDYSVDPEETTNLIDQSNYSEIAHELSTFLDGGDGWKLRSCQVKSLLIS